MTKRLFRIPALSAASVAAAFVMGAATALMAADGTPPAKVQGEEWSNFIDLFPRDTVTDAETFETNGFHVQSSQARELGGDLKPTGNRMQMLMVTAEDTFKVGIEKGRPMSAGGGLAIFNRDTGTPMLTAGDANGDGRIDVLTYSVLDDDGELILDVVDYEADGQADLRINFESSSFEIWNVDRWYPAQQRNERRGIVIDGEFVELEQRDNRWIVPTG